MSGQTEKGHDLIKKEPKSPRSFNLKSSIKVIQKRKILNEKLSSSFRLFKIRKSMNKFKSNKVNLVKKRRSSRKKFLNYADFINDIDESNGQNYLNYLEDKIVEKKLPWETYLRKRKRSRDSSSNSSLNLTQQNSNSKKETILKFERLYRKRKFSKKVTKYELARKINDKSRSIKSNIGLRTLLLNSSSTDDSADEHNSSQVSNNTQNSEVTKQLKPLAGNEVKEPGLLAYQDVIARVLKRGTERRSV